MAGLDAAIDRYAQVAVRVGLNVQPGQSVLIQAPLESPAFVRRAAEHAYAAGARHVHVEWEDEPLTLLRYRLAPEDALREYPAWRSAQMRQLAEDGAAFLAVLASDPDLLREIEPARVAAANRARSVALAPYYARISAMRTNWCVVAVPTEAWAAKVFPDAAPAERAARLWQAIFSAVRLEAPQPVAAWRTHVAALAARAEHLNRARLRVLHYRAPGTELAVELPEGHVWLAGAATDPRGFPFVPNLPTEEVFTAPRRDGVRGTVRATLPLNYRGVTIEGLTLRFEDGRVVQAEARAGQAALRGLLDTDEGSRRLGEVALAPDDSAVARLHTLFYNTLFDENAASHFALGRAYATCLQGGAALGGEGLAARGLNQSLEHVDFMVGGPEMEIDGEAATGERVPLMRRGLWAFEAPAPG